ncbi:MAG: rhodanese-like domain-containing protein [Alphaproteobacteria bacterium]
MRITFFKLLTMTITVLGFTVTAAMSDPIGDVVDSDSIQDSIDKSNIQNTTATPAKPEAAPEAAKVTITEVGMTYVEANLKKVTVVNALEKGDMIEGSIRIPANADDKVISANLKDKNAEIIVHCWSPECDAGMQLANRLVGLGYTNVKHYAGGIAEWTKNNKPTTKSK